MNKQNLLVVLLVSSAAVASIATKKLTLAGALAGAILAGCIYSGSGFTGLAMMTVFFVLGTAATSWKLQEKVQLSVAENNKGKRNAFQVFANGGFAGVMGLLAWIFPANAGAFRLMLACSLASSLSDTLSSELGNVYGRRFYNVVSWKKDSRGLNGVVSLEGSLFGMLGSAVIGTVYGFGFGWSFQVAAVIISGIFGNFADSFIGATWERRGLLQNDAVNFLNNGIAATVGLLLYWISA